MKRLTGRQRHVLERMRAGWELGLSRGASVPGRYWLQQGGLGRGGTSENVLAGTVYALFRRELISTDPKQDMFASPRRYILTDAGRAVLAGEAV